MNKKVTVLAVLAFILIIVGAIGTVGTLLLIDLFPASENYIYVVMEELDSTPIPDVEVEILERKYDNYLKEPFPFFNDHEPFTERSHRTVHSDDQGRVEVRLPKMRDGEGHYIFRFKKEGYMNNGDTSLIYKGYRLHTISTERDEDIIRFHSLGDLEGRITDLKGDPMDNITVSITNERGRVDNVCKTDPDGYYEMKNIRAGPNNLYYMGPGIEDLKNETIVIEKFQTNYHNISKPRIPSEMMEVSLTPEFDYRNGKEFIPDDGELMIAFYQEDMDDHEICISALWFKDGEFNGNVTSGGYYLKAFYMGPEEIDRIIWVDADDEFPGAGIMVRSGMTERIEIELSRTWPDI